MNRKLLSWESRVLNWLSHRSKWIQYILIGTDVEQLKSVLNLDTDIKEDNVENKFKK